MKSRIELGQKVRDMITDYTGIVVGRTEFLYGCTRIGVQGKIDKDGKVPDICWFDEPQTEVISGQKIAEDDHKTGGPMPSTPTGNQDPKR